MNDWCTYGRDKMEAVNAQNDVRKVKGGNTPYMMGT